MMFRVYWQRHNIQVKHMVFFTLKCQREKVKTVGDIGDVCECITVLDRVNRKMCEAG